MSGLPAEAHPGLRFAEVLPAPAAEVCDRFLAGAVAGEGLLGVEESVVVEAGRVRTFLQTWYPIHGDGGVVGAAALVWEVTAERDVASALSASHERLDLALASGGMGIWDWDLRTGDLRWDERTAALFGIPLTDFGGSIEHFSAFVHPDDAEAAAAAITEAIETCGELRLEYRIVRSDGQVRWVSSRGRVLTDEHGEPASLLGVIQDRTETHSEGERLARTLETMADAFFRLDAELRFTYVNARAEHLLLRPRSELLGEVIWDAFPEAVGTVFEEHYERVRTERVPTTFEARFEPLDLWVEVRALPDDGGVAVHFRDIGERKRQQAEEEAAAAREQRAHAAGARLLDVTGRMHDRRTVEEAAANACGLGIEVFACDRVSLWRVAGGWGTLLSQCGGTPLPPGTRLPLTELDDAREAISSGQPRFFGGAAAGSSPAERELADRTGARSYAYAPVELGGDAGMLVVAINWAEEVEPLDSGMLDVASRFAQQTALAIEQARSHEAQVEASRLSAQLQTSLLPSPVVLPRGVEVGALYQPGERRLLLGGDFSDVVVQPDGGISLVVGDVTGHGPEAAAIGAAMRAGWRALALHGLSPGPKLAMLDALLRTERATDEQLVTLCCVRIEPDRRRVTIASAGHPPPVLSTVEGTALVDLPVGLLLGLPVEDGDWEDRTLELSAPWSLLLYTDGLPEARVAAGSAQRVGLDGFTDHVRALDPLDAEDLDGMLRRLQHDVRAHAGQAIDDDVALLVLRADAGGGPTG